MADTAVMQQAVRDESLLLSHKMLRVPQDTS